MMYRAMLAVPLTQKIWEYAIARDFTMRAHGGLRLDTILLI